MSSNSNFYNRVITLRTAYSNKDRIPTDRKVYILSQIVSISFRNWEILPDNFFLDLPGYTVFSAAYRLREQIIDVLNDLEYSNVSVSHGYFYEGATRFKVSLIP